MFIQFIYLHRQVLNKSPHRERWNKIKLDIKNAFWARPNITKTWNLEEEKIDLETFVFIFYLFNYILRIIHLIRYNFISKQIQFKTIFFAKTVILFHKIFNILIGIHLIFQKCKFKMSFNSKKIIHIHSKHLTNYVCGPCSE